MENQNPNYKLEKIPEFIPEFEEACEKSFVGMVEPLKELSLEPDGLEYLKYILLHLWINTCGIPVSEDGRIHSDIRGFGMLILKDIKSYIISEKTFAKKLTEAFCSKDEKTISLCHAINLITQHEPEKIFQITQGNKTYLAKNIKASPNGFILTQRVKIPNEPALHKYSIFENHPLHPLICGHILEPSLEINVEIKENPEIKQIFGERYLISKNNHPFTRDMIHAISQ
jgi:hypothetical protein